jgi:hypothetical protein
MHVACRLRDLYTIYSVWRKTKNDHHKHLVRAARLPTESHQHSHLLTIYNLVYNTLHQTNVFHRRQLEAEPWLGQQSKIIIFESANGSFVCSKETNNIDNDYDVLVVFITCMMGQTNVTQTTHKNANQ